MHPQGQLALADAGRGTGPRERAASARLPGPGTPLDEVFTACEALGHARPGAAWSDFVSGCHWAAPLPEAEPADDDPRTVPWARPADGGHVLSGEWRLAPAARGARWVALPALVERDRPVFVVRRTQGAEGVDGYRLRELFVPDGLTSSAGGTPLRSADAPYAWAAATGTAFGSARRLLAEGTTTHLAALLERERDAVHGRLRNAPEGGDERLAERVDRAAHVVREVYSACCEEGPDGLPLRPASLVTAGAPLLQFLRFATELLPFPRAGAR
ncbi:hypothetical protein [Actinacidiphila glaucinigra]|uniref:hypothetical protein n=1 Tax=Actinacidiphila glaucinigra TaxID=235986 RepID=UPI0035E1517D